MKSLLRQYIKIFASFLLLVCFALPFLASCNESFADAEISLNASAGNFTETVVAGTTETMMSAVYAYGSYEISLRNAVYDSNGKDDGKMLTDRVYTNAKPKDDDEKTEGWVMIKSYDGETDYRATVTVDFGFTAKDVDRFYLRAFRSTELNAEMPQSIRFYASADGESFEYLGDGTTMTDLSIDNSAAVYGITLKQGVTARYMRATVECAGAHTLWLNEVGAAASGMLFRANNDGEGLIRDSQGLVYRINNDVAEIVHAESLPYGEYATLPPSNYSFDSDGSRYTLGKGSDNEISVISDFIGEGRPNYSGVPNNIQYIVIHNTGTTEEVTDSERYNLRMHTTDGETSWHYTVDDNKIYHSLSDSVVGWHAGSSHNYCSIGIEICTNGAPQSSSGKFYFSGSAYEEWVETRFKKSLRNTAVLVAELLTRYGLSTDAVIQHYDVTEKNCPLWLREKNGKFVYDGTLWVEFMGYVEEYYALFNGKNAKPVIRPDSKIVIPDYITTNDGEVYPVSVVCDDAFVEKGSALSKLHIGKMVESFSCSALDGCDSIDSITVSNGNDYLKYENAVLSEKDGNVIYDPAKVVVTKPSPLPESNLDIREIDGRYYLFLETERYTLSELASLYGASEYNAIAYDGSTAAPDEILGTGYLLNFGGARMFLVVLGDANGDTAVDAYDYILIKRTYFGTFVPLKRQIYSMTLTNGKTVCTYDYIAVKRYVLGTYNPFK